MILPVVMLVACCIDSPPFVPINQQHTIEVGDKGITVEQLDKLEPGVVYTITQNGQETAGTVEVGAMSGAASGAASVSETITQPDFDLDLATSAIAVSP